MEKQHSSFKLIIFVFVLQAAMLFSSCTLVSVAEFLTTTTEERKSAAETTVTDVYGGTYVWQRESKLDTNLYVEYFLTDLEGAEGSIAVKVRVNSSLSGASMYFSTDYLCKIFAQDEKALYDPLMAKCFDDYQIVVKTTDRYCPAYASYQIDSKTGEETKIDPVNFEIYKLQMFNEPGTDENFTPLNVNEVDAYFIIRSEEASGSMKDEKRMEAFFLEMMKKGYWINGKFLIADQDFTDELSSITEDMLTEEYFTRFKKIYIFNGQENFSYE